jgi:hypothetical protein
MLALFALAILPAPLCANTYLFSFTGSQVLTALGSTDPNESQTGFFAIMAQPNIDFAQQITWGPISAPTAPQSGEAWNTGTITDFSLGNSNPFVRFDKAQVQANVAVLTNDPNFGWDMQGTPFHDSLTWPEGWGNSSGTIQDELPTTGSAGTFSFVLTTAQSLGSTSTITGKAFGYNSGDGKTEEYDFTLTATVTNAVPEPDNWGLIGTGVLLLAIGTYTKRKARAKRPES